MVTDERGFPIDADSIEEVSFDELKEAFKRLVNDYSKQSIELRILKIRADEQLNWLINNRISESVLEEIRSQTLANYLANLPPLKGTRGPKINHQENARAYAYWKDYEALEGKKPPLKKWLRTVVERDFKDQNASCVVRKAEITKNAKRFEARILRIKEKIAAKNQTAT